MHGIRKTCASLLAALDVHPRVAMRILRHSKIAVTMEIYTEAPSDATSRCSPQAQRLAHMTVAAVCCCYKSRRGRFQDRNRPVTWVELRGFEPLTPSMRTRCATGLRYSPENLS